MITVKSLRISKQHASDSKLYYGTGSYITNTQLLKKSLRPVVFRDLVCQSQKVRPKAEYLWNGPVLDRHGNKAVRNRQIKGSITLPALVGQMSSGQRPEPRDFVQCRFISCPPVVKIGNSEYYEVQLAPVEFGGWYTNSSNYQCSVTYSRAFQATKGWYVITASIDGNWWKDDRKVYYGAINSSGVTNIPAIVAAKSKMKSLYGTTVEEGQEWHFINTLRSILHSVYNEIAAYVISRDINRFSFSSSLANVDYRVGSLPDIDKIVGVYLPLLDTHHFDEYELSRHARDVVERVNDFDSNMIAYVSDLKEIGGTVKSLLHLASDYKNPKAWASAWLSGQFGDRLQIADTRELLESLYRAGTTRLLWTKARARLSWENFSNGIFLSHDRTSTIYVSNTQFPGIEDTIGNLMKWDAWPTLENTWDLVPLSFLVDWVMPVSDLLGQIDAAVEAPYLDPYSQYVGEKWVASVVLSSDQFTASLQFSLYTRDMYNVVGDVRPFDWAPSLPSFSVVHLADAFALLVQTV
jgi:hypothetical protein